tara:strand:+ start:2028 stop:2552 length:525 start_codon:yes stop_codon:yes gene_type:complete
LGLNIIQIKEEGEEMDKVIEETMAIIDMYPDIFPHMYKQGFKLVNRIKKGNLVLQDGVMITFTQYLQGGKLSRNATTIKKPKDFIIHQIASDQTQKGATKKVLDEFVDYCKSKGAGNILLTVRAFNERARKFYERYGFKYDSDIQWNSQETGIIPGVIYKLQLEKIKSEKFFQF